MKDDERRFLIDVYNRCDSAYKRKVDPELAKDLKYRTTTPRRLIVAPGFYMHHKRAWYLLEKWTRKGWYEYGVTLDLGWLTEEGERACGGSGGGASMIRLTRVDGRDWYINPDQIVDVTFYEDSKLASVQTVVDGYCVNESPEEIAWKILNYRLSMETYRAQNTRICNSADIHTVVSETFSTEENLKRLAGLEEPKG